MVLCNDCNHKESVVRWRRGDAVPLPNYFGHSFLIIPTRLRVLMVKTFLIANAHTVCRSHMVHVRAQSDKDSDLGKLP